MTSDMLTEGNVALDAAGIVTVICVSVVVVSALWVFITFSDMCCCLPRPQGGSPVLVDEEQKYGVITTDSENTGVNGGDSSGVNSQQQGEPPSEAIGTVTAKTDTKDMSDTRTMAHTVKQKSDKKPGFFSKKENKKAGASSSADKNIPVSDRINSFESSDTHAPGALRGRDEKPKRKKPTSKAFQEFESRGIIIGFGNMPRKRVLTSEEREEDDTVTGHDPNPDDLEVPRSRTKFDDQHVSTKSPENDTSSNTNSLSRLTDDEGIHTMDEEDELNAVPRQSEVLKSFRRAPPPKNRSRASRQIHQRMVHGHDMTDFAGFDFPMELDETTAESEYSGETTPSRSTDSIVTPSDRATPDNDIPTSGHHTEDDSPRGATPDSATSPRGATPDSATSPRGATPDSATSPRGATPDSATSSGTAPGRLMLPDPSLYTGKNRYSESDYRGTSHDYMGREHNSRSDINTGKYQPGKLASSSVPRGDTNAWSVPRGDTDAWRPVSSVTSSVSTSQYEKATVEPRNIRPAHGGGPSRYNRSTSENTPAAQGGNVASETTSASRAKPRQSISDFRSRRGQDSEIAVGVSDTSRKGLDFRGQDFNQRNISSGNHGNRSSISDYRGGTWDSKRNEKSEPVNRSSVSDYRSGTWDSRHNDKSESVNRDKPVVLLVDSGLGETGNQGNKDRSRLRTRKSSTKEVNEVSFTDFMNLLQRSNSKTCQSPPPSGDPGTRRLTSDVDLPRSKVSFRTEGTAGRSASNIIAGSPINKAYVSPTTAARSITTAEIQSPTFISRFDLPMGGTTAIRTDPNVNNNNVKNMNNTVSVSGACDNVERPSSGNQGNNNKLMLTRPRSFHPASFTRPRDSPSPSSTATNNNNPVMRTRFMSATGPALGLTAGQERLGAQRARSLSLGSPKFLRKWDSEFSGLEARKKSLQEAETKTDDDQTAETKKKVFQSLATRSTDVNCNYSASFSCTNFKRLPYKEEIEQVFRFKYNNVREARQRGPDYYQSQPILKYLSDKEKH